jgi:putative transposase
MARKSHSDEDILKLLREIEVHVHSGMDVVSACRKAGVSDKTYYASRPTFSATNRIASDTEHHFLQVYLLTPLC